MDLKSQKQMAAKILKCGVSRVWVDPKRMGEVNEAITKADIRALIRRGVIKELHKIGVSRGRARKRMTQKKKGRRKGHGSRKGKLGARFSRKRAWMNRIRAIRKILKELRDASQIDKKTYRNLYRKAKGGFFRSKAHLKNYLEREGLIKKEDGDKDAKKKKA